MNRLSVMTTLLTTFVAAVPAWAGSPLPEPISQRLILHGVDCSIADGVVCDEERPVFDEAIAAVPGGGAVLIKTQVLNGVSGEPADALPNVTTAAVRAYFIANGIAPEQVGIEGCNAATAVVNWTPPIAVQLSTNVQ